MEFFWRGGAGREVIAAFPGAWNPPTRAHVAMAEAALAHAPEVVLVIARAMPHKTFEGPPFDRRVAWLRALCVSRPGISAAVADSGLFLGIARELRDAAGAGRVLLVCGRDAAERIVNWDYGPEYPAIEDQLKEFELLVAPRCGPYEPPEALRTRVHRLELPPEWSNASSSGVRLLRELGQPWRHLVPPEIGEF